MERPHKPLNLFFISLLTHVFILTLLIVNMNLSSRNFVLENSNQNEIINASILIPSKIQTTQPSHVISKPLPEPKKIVPPTPHAAPPVKVQHQVQKAPAPEVHQKTIVIPTHHKKQVLQKEIEKQLLDDLKQVQKKKKHKELVNAFEKELKEQSAKSIESQLKNEESQLANARAAKMQGIVDKYKALIIEAIAQYWVVPSGVDKSLSTDLLIRVAPGGAVLNVQLEKSSGDDALDRSAQAAVYKASPLPVPSKSDEFEPFHEFILKVKPEYVLTRDNGLN